MHNICILYNPALVQKKPGSMCVSVLCVRLSWFTWGYTIRVTHKCISHQLLSEANYARLAVEQLPTVWSTLCQIQASLGSSSLSTSQMSTEQRLSALTFPQGPKRIQICRVLNIPPDRGWTMSQEHTLNTLFPKANVSPVIRRRGKGTSLLSSSCKIGLSLPDVDERQIHKFMDSLWAGKLTSSWKKSIHFSFMLG